MGWSFNSMMATAWLFVVAWLVFKLWARPDPWNKFVAVMILVIAVFAGGMPDRPDGHAITANRIPSEFIFINGIVRDPDPINGVEGAVWILMRVMDNPAEPVLVRFPYVKDLADSVERLNYVARVKEMEIPVKLRKEEQQEKKTT